MSDSDGPRRRLCKAYWFAEWWASMATTPSLNVMPDGCGDGHPAIRASFTRSDASVSAHRTLPIQIGACS